MIITKDVVFLTIWLLVTFIGAFVFTRAVDNGASIKKRRRILTIWGAFFLPATILAIVFVGQFMVETLLISAVSVILYSAMRKFAED